MPVTTASEHGVLYQATSLADAPDEAEELKGKWAPQTEGAIDAIAERVNEVVRTTRPEALPERLAEIEPELRKKFDRATGADRQEEVLQEVAVRRKSIESKALTPKEPISEARMIEIRSLVGRELEKPSGDILVESMAREAARADDRHFLLALERAPRGFKLLPDETLEQLRELQIASAYPEAYTELSAKRTLAEMLAFNRRIAAERLTKLTRGAIDFRPQVVPLGLEEWPELPEDEEGGE